MVPLEFSMVPQWFLGGSSGSCSGPPSGSLTGALKGSFGVSRSSSAQGGGTIPGGGTVPGGRFSLGSFLLGVVLRKSPEKVAFGVVSPKGRFS